MKKPDNHSKEETTKLEDDKKRRKLVSRYRIGISGGNERERKGKKISEQKRLALLDEQLASMGENLEGLMKRVGSSEKQEMVAGQEPPKKERKRRTKEELEKDKALEVEQDKRKEKDLAKAVEKVKGRMEARAQNSKELKTLENESLTVLFKRRKIGVGTEEDVVGGMEGSSTSNSGREQDRLEDGRGGEKRTNKVKVFVSEKSRVDGILKEMEGGALVPVYPKRTVARLLPEPKKRLRPITKEIGIQASFSRAMVPWVSSPLCPAAVLPPPPIPREMLMPPPPASSLLPTSTSTDLAFFRQTPPPPPQSRVVTMQRKSKKLSNSKKIIPVDPRRSATPTQEENKEEDDDVVILEPNDPPAWKLLKIYFPSKKKKSRRSSSRTSSEHDSSRRSRSSTTSPSRKSHGKSESSDKSRSSRKHKSSHRKSSRHHKSRRNRPHSSTRTSRKTKRHHRQVKKADKGIPVVILSDSPAEPDRESDRCPSTSVSEAIKPVRTKDVKGCTEIFDSSRRQWPEPVRESGRHPVRIINCYHVLREKKLMPVVDLTVRSPHRERMTKEHGNLKTFHVPSRGPKFPALLALTAPPTSLPQQLELPPSLPTYPVFPPLPKEPPPVSPSPPPPPPPYTPELEPSVPDSVLMPPPPPPNQTKNQIRFRIQPLRTRSLSPPPASYFTPWD